MHEQTKDVEIGGARYQVGRFSARDGSWVLMKLLPLITTALSATKPENDEAAIAFFARVIGQIGQTDEETFRKIQEHALAVCRRLENGVPMPVFLRPNTWAVKELEYDLVTVLALTANALVFNLSPFFSDGGLKQLFESIPGLNSPNPSR
jgi:hypothetical protein